ncbi:MAG TPA: hypothetical protein VHD83_27860 [Puia sp.]|nr:hypothetical protein [Puia sp.]
MRITTFHIKPAALTLSALLVLAACSKHSSPVNPGKPYPEVTDSSYQPADPAVPPTVGFFLDGWQSKVFAAPDTVIGSIPPYDATDSLTINVNQVVAKVSPYLYGNNSNLWMGQIVTQSSLMQYIKDLAPRIIRAPAGSVSDTYFWNGVDTAHRPWDAPDSVLDASGMPVYIGDWYGGNWGSWTFALDNYYTLLSQTNSTGIITVNYGYARYGTSANPVAAAAHLAANWVRYDNGRTKFWEIGNETYGSWEAGYFIDTTRNQDHQPYKVTGALYGSHVKIFADSMRAAAREVGATIYIGATLYQQAPAAGDDATLQTWNNGVLANAGSAADYFIVHNYFTAYNTNSGVADILSSGLAVPGAMMSYVKQQVAAAGLSQKPIALTEWNIQATGSKQNVSFISGMQATLTLGNLIKSQYGEASRWDLGNGYSSGDDQGMFNVGDEPGAPQWNPRPAFFYMYYFQRMFGDRMVYDTLRRALLNTDIYTYSSTFSSGQAGSVIVNNGPLNHVVAVDFQHFPAGSKYYYYTLTGGTDNPPFSGQVLVNGSGPATATGGPLNYATLKAYGMPLKGSIKVWAPPYSVIYLVAEKK